MDDSKKLKGKDLINIGIFSAIYFVVIMALAMLGFIPIFMPTYSALMPLLGGIVFILFLTKVKKFDIIDKHSSGGQTQREEKTQI